LPLLALVSHSGIPASVKDVPAVLPVFAVLTAFEVVPTLLVVPVLWTSFAVVPLVAVFLVESVFDATA
jgi:hypothetical protein